MDNLTELSDVMLWSLIVGAVSPPILAILQQPRWSTALRAFLTLLWSLIAGALTAYFNGAFEGKGIVTSILLVLAATIVFYKGWWKPSGVAPAIERSTSPGTPPAV